MHNINEFGIIIYRYTIIRSIVCVYGRYTHMILVQVKNVKNKVNLDCGNTITCWLSLGGGVGGGRERGRRATQCAGVGGY